MVHLPTVNINHMESSSKQNRKFSNLVCGHIVQIKSVLEKEIIMDLHLTFFQEFDT